VTAGKGDLQGASPERLAANLGEIGHLRIRDEWEPAHDTCARRGVRWFRRELDPGGRRPDRSAPARARLSKELEHVTQRFGRQALDSAGQPGLDDGARRNDDPSDPALSERGDHGQDPRHGSDIATQRQLTDEGPSAGGPNLL
jgi:hypothetical protein